MNKTIGIVFSLLLSLVLVGCGGSDGAVGGADGANGTNGTNGAGAEGKQGPAGPAGAAGAPGKDGAQGPAGPAGADGTAAAKGDTGAAGPQGPAGVAGAAGAAGAKGDKGDPGAPGAPGDPGNIVEGDQYIVSLAVTVPANGSNTVRALCNDVNDVVMNGGCTWSINTLGQNGTSSKAYNAANAALVSGWECIGNNFSSTPFTMTANVVCLVVP